jgi:hypothetical protein
MCLQTAVVAAHQTCYHWPQKGTSCGNHAENRIWWDFLRLCMIFCWTSIPFESCKYITTEFWTVNHLKKLSIRTCQMLVWCGTMKDYIVGPLFFQETNVVTHVCLTCDGPKITRPNTTGLSPLGLWEEHHLSRENCRYSNSMTLHKRGLKQWLKLCFEHVTWDQIIIWCVLSN